MNEQKIKSFFLTLVASFMGCYLALVFFNTSFDLGKIFLPKPARPAEMAAPSVPITNSAAPVDLVLQEQQAQRELYKSACKEEINRSCSKPGLEDIIGCLLDQESSSLVCKNSLQIFTKHLKPCEAEIRTFCSGVKFGSGRINTCLKKNQERISSAACLQAISK